jgi:hypothetical protein
MEIANTIEPVQDGRPHIERGGIVMLAEIAMRNALVLSQLGHSRREISTVRSERALPRRLQLALEPSHHSLGFQGIGPVTVKTLERARTFAVGKQR